MTWSVLPSPVWQWLALKGDPAWPLLVLGVCRHVAEGAEQSGAVWERKPKGIVHSFHMAAPREFAGEFSGQTALLVLQSSPAQKVAGWLWAWPATKQLQTCPGESHALGNWQLWIVKTEQLRCGRGTPWEQFCGTGGVERNFFFSLCALWQHRSLVGTISVLHAAL